jgi:hypothetical protein
MKAGKPTDHLILLECRLSSNGKTFSRASMAVSDGKTAVIDTIDKADHSQFVLELTARRRDKT